MKNGFHEGEEKSTVTKLIGLAYDYLSVKTEGESTPFFTGDLLFILPSVKKCISLYDAIIDDVAHKRLLSATILSRTLIEVVVILLYVTNIKKDEGFYSKFMEHGRLRVKKTGKGWQKVTIVGQISWVEENYGITKLQAVYDNCSKLVHFSDSATQLILDRRKEKSDGSVGIIIGTDEAQFPQENFDEIIKTCEGMLSILSSFLEAAIQGKRIRANVITNVEPDMGQE